MVPAVMSVAIVSDTCHYLPREVVAEQGIHEVSLYVQFADGAQREADITDYNAYYRRLGSEAELPTTSQPSIGDFLAVYEPLLSRGDEIVSIHLAGGMSGTVRAAEQAREQLGESVAVYLDGGPSAGGTASTIVDVTDSAPRLLRQGAISIGRLREVAGVRAS